MSSRRGARSGQGGGRGEAGHAQAHEEGQQVDYPRGEGQKRYSRDSPRRTSFYGASSGRNRRHVTARSTGTHG